MPLRLDSSDKGFEADFAALVDGRRGVESDVGAVVDGILADVDARGDAAVLDYTKKFDRLDLTADRLRITDGKSKARSPRCRRKCSAHC